LAIVTSPSDLQALLEAGTLHAEYGRRFSFPLPVDWETVRLPRVVARIAELASQTGDWSALNQATRWLLSTADRQALLNQQAFRKENLSQAAHLLVFARATGRSLIQKTGGAAEVVDLLLPGDIAVDKVAGSLRYQRLSGEFEGSFRGALQLPKFGLALTIQNASFSRDGAFDVNAFGQLSVPASSPALSATIPRSQPVHVSWSASEGLRLSGEAAFSLANGMSFKGSIGLEDPIYRFRLEAGGLQLRLAKTLLTNVPAFPPAASFQKNGALDEAGLALWSGLYSSLGDMLGGFGIMPPATDPAAGSRSGFSGASPGNPALSAAEAWTQLNASSEPVAVPPTRSGFSLRRWR
jgi:hypothetical protein